MAWKSSANDTCSTAMKGELSNLKGDTEMDPHQRHAANCMSVIRDLHIEITCESAAMSMVRCLTFNQVMMTAHVFAQAVPSPVWWLLQDYLSREKRGLREQLLVANCTLM